MRIKVYFDLEEEEILTEDELDEYIKSKIDRDSILTEVYDIYLRNDSDEEIFKAILTRNNDYLFSIRNKYNEIIREKEQEASNDIMDGLISREIEI